MSFQKAKTIYAITVYVSLAAFDNIVIGLFPPLFSNIAHDMGVKVAYMGLVSAINILATSLSSLFWGYLSGKFHRKRLIIIGTLIWVLGVSLTALSGSYIQLLAYQVITGIGLGCVASIGFSALTDYVPHRSRGMILSLWGMSQGFGGIAGALIAAIISTLSNWRLPFEVLGLIGLLLVVFYFFVEEPKFGNAEPELQRLIKGGKSYTHRISMDQVMMMVRKRSNLLLFLQGFFINIATGSLIWLPQLYILKIEQLHYGKQIAVIIATFLFGIFQIGGTLSSVFGYIGDVLQRRSYAARARTTAALVLVTMPLYILLFIFPIHNLSLPDTTNSAVLFFSLLEQMLLNPWMLTLFIISLFASAAQSANTPNWLALITDVNLPEHRGTVFGMANLVNSLGRTIGNLGIGAVVIASIFLHSPSDYILTMSLLQLPLIPSAFCYFVMAKYNVHDICSVKRTLNKRGKIV